MRTELVGVPCLPEYKVKIMISNLMKSDMALMKYFYNFQQNKYFVTFANKKII